MFNIKSFLFVIVIITLTVWFVQVFGDKHLEPKN